MSSFPESWVLLPLGEVIQTKKGKKPIELGPKSNERTVPYINIAAFETKIVGEYAPEQDIPKCEITDTLLVWDGARAGLSGRGISGYIGSTLARVTSDLCEPSYLFYFINSNYETLNSQTKGVGIPHINPVVLNELQFPLAPLPEQKRIVDKLEELLSDLDAGVDELKSAQAKLVQYRQSLLKSAVKGTLSAEWRTKNTPKETGEELLQHMLKERRKNWEEKQLAKYKEQGKEPPKGWKDKYPEPVQPDTKDLPELPNGWVWTSIGQCFHVAVGATPSRKIPSYWNGDVPWVSSGEVQFNRITKTRESITQEGLKNSSTQINPVGSVLLGMIGEGKTRGQVSILDITAANNQNCAAIWVSDTDIESEYVYYWLWSRYEETRRGSSGNNQPALNKSIVESIPFPLPPVIEIKAIVELVSTSFEQIESQDTALKASLKYSETQRKNILKSAFSGQLVSQSDADESASVLLEKILAKRKEQQSLPKQKRVIRKTKDNEIMAKTLIEVLTESDDWLPAQEAFRRCGMSDSASTDEIEAIYSQLRQLDQAKKLEVNTVYFDDGRKQFDRIRLLVKD